MKRHLVLAAVAATLAAVPALSEVAPADVKFVEGAVADSLTGTAGDAAAGAKVIADRTKGNCVACHQVAAQPDVPFQGNIGPALDGAGSRWDAAQLRGIVTDAKHTFEGTMMPSMYKTAGFIRPGDGFTGKAAPADLAPILSAQEIEDAVAYLLTLKD